MNEPDNYTDADYDRFMYEKHIAELEAYIEDRDRYIKVLSDGCADLQKSYNKQHDYYKDIFISLVKVERENEKLLSEINK